MSKFGRLPWLGIAALVIMSAKTSNGYAAVYPLVFHSIAVPAPNSVAPALIGIATIRRGPIGMIVFGSSLKIDLTQLRSQSGFAQAQVIPLPDATVVTVPVEQNEILNVTPRIASWIVAIERRSQISQAVTPLLRTASIAFPTAGSGASVMVSDPVTGDPLLVGTVTSAAAIRTKLRGVGYATLPAWRGIVVQALSDELTLKSTRQGFALKNTGFESLLPLNQAVVPADSLSAPTITRSLGLANGSIIELRHRLLRAQISLAEAPPLDQLPASLRLAQVLLALGMGPEASGVLKNALRDDPASEGNVLRERLFAVSTILSGRLYDFSGPSHKEVDQSKEMRLWRAVALARQGHTKSAARSFAANFQIFLGYPRLLRRSLAPLVVETLIRGGQIAAAQSILHALPKQAGLGLARAEFLEVTNHRALALAAYRKVRLSRDVRSAGIATTRAILLRHSMHQILAKEAAAELSRNLYAWRGRHHEVHVRIALALLRAKAGEWAQSLHGLKRAITLLPQSLQELQSERRKLFTNMIASGALSKLGPLEAVSAVQENEDMIPAGVEGAPILNVLARRLLDLDLPGIAAPVLKDLIIRTEAGPSQARLELALARVDLQSDNLRGAETALTQTNLSNLPSNLAAKRQFYVAEIEARGGHMSGALRSLAKSNDAPTVALKSHLQLAAHDWKSAEVTLQARVARLQPSTGMLTRAAARLVAQLATAASNGGDATKLAVIRAKYAHRMPPGSNTDLFDTITTPALDPKANLSAALKQIASIERLDKSIPASTPSSSVPR